MSLERVQKGPERHTILVVDDNRIFLETLVDNLASADDRFRVLAASSGAAALEILGATRVDLLMTDLRMPAMDGLELVRRAGAFSGRIPTIVMSGNSMDEPAQLEAMGIDAVLEKPFSHTEALSLIRRLMTGNG